MSGRYTHHHEIKALAAEPSALQAEAWNAARRALARQAAANPEAEAEPIWLDLPGLRTMRLVLLPEAFVVTDRALGHLPVAAWTAFTPPPERGLHQDVPCTLCHYHSRAGAIAGTVQEIMCRQLRAQLSEGRGPGPGEIVALPRRG